MRVAPRSQNENRGDMSEITHKFCGVQAADWLSVGLSDAQFDFVMAVIRFKDSEKLVQYDDFKKLESDIKTHCEFDVFGFLDSGVFRTIREVAENLKTKISRDFERVKSALRTNARRRIPTRQIERDAVNRRKYRHKRDFEKRCPVARLSRRVANRNPKMRRRI